MLMFLKKSPVLMSEVSDLPKLKKIKIFGIFRLCIRKYPYLL